MLSKDLKDECDRAWNAAQSAATNLNCAMSWFRPDDDEDRDPKQMVTMLLGDAEQSLQMALVAIRKAKAAV